jgi:putative inorganic carbon (HCO3(-)) transporter
MITSRTLRFPAAAVFAILLLISLTVTYFIVQHGLSAGIMVLLFSVAVILVAVVIRNYRVGFYLVFLMGSFMFIVDRLAHIDFPTGTIYDGLIGLVFLSLFTGNHRNDWRSFKNPVTITFFVLIVYQVLQLFNPSATSTLAWLVSWRNNSTFLLYIAAFQVFSSLKEVKRFTWIWMATLIIIAAYGIYQHIFGLPAFEMAYLNEVPERVKLYINWGELRSFSILPDPSSYGLFTGMGALAAMVLALGPFKLTSRIGYGILMLIFLVAMSYSGTRTAIAMFAVGVIFYVIVMLHNRKTLFASGVIVFMGLALLFGPFYGGTMSRLRSTFRGSDDPSMAVRDYKRIKFQKYIQTHPIGGGLNSVGSIGLRYSPGHELAGEWEPDSGYLLTALESGWIGLIIFMTMFFVVLLSGINNFFSMNDPVLKTYLLAYVVPFMALSVAHFTQDAMFTKPMNAVIFTTYALVYKIPSLQKKLFSVELV